MSKKLDKWAPIINSLSSDKELPSWLEQYKEIHTSYESNCTTLLGTQSNEKFPSLLPIAMKVSAQSIGLDLVSVKPMKGFGDEELYKRAKNKVTAINRERQIDEILFDKKYEPITIEETEEYKEYEKTCGPKMNIGYIDFIYGSTSSNKTII